MKHDRAGYIPSIIQADMLLQELRRKVTEMEKRNRELEQLHQLDLSEITRLRRMIEQMEGKE